MQELLRELSLSASSAFDADQAPRFGKLLGATHVLGGKLALLGTGRLQVDPQLVRATTGDVTLPDEQSGTLSEFFSMEKRVVYSVLEQLGITLSLAERDSIEIMPTQSFDAFLAYSRGINYEDHGQYDLAHEEFTRAIKLDPAFQDARARAAESQYMIGATGTDESVETFAQETSKTTEWGLPAVATDRRLEALLNNAGLVRVSADGTPAGDDTPYTAPAGGESQVIIRGRFDD